uniref:Uncharacterized protein n=1 Tax=Anopheles culicifacies TaxID=139723 RepID=A0A182M6E1_9DIPT
MGRFLKFWYIIDCEELTGSSTSCFTISVLTENFSSILSSVVPFPTRPPFPPFPLAAAATATAAIVARSFASLVLSDSRLVGFRSPPPSVPLPEPFAPEPPLPPPPGFIGPGSIWMPCLESMWRTRWYLRRNFDSQ